MHVDDFIVKMAESVQDMLFSNFQAIVLCVALKLKFMWSRIIWLTGGSILGGW